jgi:hypothetical protein
MFSGYILEWHNGINSNRVQQVSFKALKATQKYSSSCLRKGSLLLFLTFIKKLHSINEVREALRYSSIKVCMCKEFM